MPPIYLDEQHGMSISEAYAEAAQSAPAIRVMLACYALNHPTFDEPVYIVNDHQNFTATLETGPTAEFIACPVDVIPPEESDSAKAPTISVRIDGVSRILTERLDAATGSLEMITLTERIYASDDPSAPAVMPPLEMTLRDVVVGETTVTAQAGFSDPANMGFPAKDYLAREYPGLAAR